MTPIEEVRLEIGLIGQAYQLLSDEEIQYFLNKNNGNIRRASSSAGKTVLFILSQLVHTKASELESWDHDWFNNYYKTLQMYLNDPNFSFAINGAMPYAGGISVADIRANIENYDNLVVDVDAGIPTDGDAYYLPLDTSDTFKTYFSPANKFDLANTLGEQAYIFEYADGKGSKIEIESESNLINILRRPAIVVRAVAGATP